MRDSRRVVTDVVDGAIAGAVATWVMGMVTTALYQRESAAHRAQEDNARHGKTAYGVAAEKVARLAGATLADGQRAAYGKRVHWALGLTAGALYGVMRDRLPNRAMARGLAFGTAFWLLIDEGATPVLGLTPGPGAFPWSTHARGLAWHLAFGTVADLTLDALHATA